MPIARCINNKLIALRNCVSTAFVQRAIGIFGTVAVVLSSFVFVSPVSAADDVEDGFVQDGLGLDLPLDGPDMGVLSGRGAIANNGLYCGPALFADMAYSDDRSFFHKVWQTYGSWASNLFTEAGDWYAPTDKSVMIRCQIDPSVIPSSVDLEPLVASVSFTLNRTSAFCADFGSDPRIWRATIQSGRDFVIGCTFPSNSGVRRTAWNDKCIETVSISLSTSAFGVNPLRFGVVGGACIPYSMDPAVGGGGAPSWGDDIPDWATLRGCAGITVKSPDYQDSIFLVDDVAEFRLAKRRGSDDIGPLRVRVEWTRTPQVTTTGEGILIKDLGWFTFNNDEVPFHQILEDGWTDPMSWDFMLYCDDGTQAPVQYDPSGRGGNPASAETLFSLDDCIADASDWGLNPIPALWDRIVCYVSWLLIPPRTTTYYVNSMRGRVGEGFLGEFVQLTLAPVSAAHSVSRNASSNRQVAFGERFIQFPEMDSGIKSVVTALLTITIGLSVLRRWMSWIRWAMNIRIPDIVSGEPLDHGEVEHQIAARTWGDDYWHEDGGHRGKGGGFR